MEMPPVNLLDPIMRHWLQRVSPTVSKNGQMISLPLTHWPTGEAITYIGVMADEVEHANPAAIIKVNGTSVVDYDKAAESPGTLTIYSYQYKADAASAILSDNQVGRGR
jgi:hypothetical protein